MLKNSCLLATLFIAGYAFGSLDHDLTQPGIMAGWVAGFAQIAENIFHTVSSYSGNIFSGILLFADDVHKYPLLTVAALIGISVQIFALKKPGSPKQNTMAVIVPDAPPATALSQLPALAPKRQAERNAEGDATSTAPAIPRVLLNNPYDKKIEYLTFEERVQIAVQASLRKGRVIGVIYFHLDFTPRFPPGAQSLTTNEAMLPQLAAELETQLRATDCVKCVSATEIAVFVSLLSDSAQLNSVTQRLSATLVRLMSENESFSAQIFQGSVLYPIGGYSSVDLIASARQKAKPVERSPLLASQTPASVDGKAILTTSRSGTAFTVN